jgi:hypothetical protein
MVVDFPSMSNVNFAIPGPCLIHLTMKVRTATCAGARAARVAAVAGEHKTFLPTSAVRCGSAASLHWDFFMGVSYLMLDIFRLLSLLLVLELR